MMGSAEKPGVSKTLANAVSLKSRPSEGRNRGNDTDKVTLLGKHFLKSFIKLL